MPHVHGHASSRSTGSRRLMIACAAIGALTAGMVVGGWGISLTIRQARATAQRATAAFGLPLPTLLQTPKRGGFHQWPYTVSISESELEAWAAQDDTLSNLLNERAKLVRTAVSEIGSNQAGLISQLANVDTDLAAVTTAADATSATTTADVGRMEQMLFQLAERAMPGSSLDSLGLTPDTMSMLTTSGQDPDAVRSMMETREADGSADIEHLRSQAGSLTSTRDAVTQEARETKSRLELQHEQAITSLDQKIAARFFELERTRATDLAARATGAHDDWRTADDAARHAQIIVRRVHGTPPSRAESTESRPDLANVEPDDADSLR